MRREWLLERRRAGREARAFTALKMKWAAKLRRLKGLLRLQRQHLEEQYKARLEKEERNKKSMNKALSHEERRVRQQKAWSQYLQEYYPLMIVAWILFCMALCCFIGSIIYCQCLRKRSKKTAEPFKANQSLPRTTMDADRSVRGMSPNETPRGFGRFLEAAKKKLGERLTPDGENALKELAKDSANMCRPSKALRTAIRRDVPFVTRDAIMAASRES